MTGCLIWLGHGSQVNTPVVTFAGEPGKMYTVLLVHEAPVEVAAAAMGATLHFAGANLNIYNASVAQGVPLNQLGAFAVLACDACLLLGVILFKPSHESISIFLVLVFC